MWFVKYSVTALQPHTDHRAALFNDVCVQSEQQVNEIGPLYVFAVWLLEDLLHGFFWRLFTARWYHELASEHNSPPFSFPCIFMTCYGV